MAEHWRRGALEAPAAASHLLAGGHYRQAAFPAHLAVEKALKARVCLATGGVPPRLHDLLRLCELGQVEVGAAQVTALAKLNASRFEARYPAMTIEPLDPAEASGLVE